MKLNKSLLQAMMVGIALGGAASCSLIENVTDKDIPQEEPTQNENGTCTDPETKGGGDLGNCPGCGMG